MNEIVNKVEADFAVRLTGQELSPYIRKGEVAYFVKTA